MKKCFMFIAIALMSTILASPCFSAEPIKIGALYSLTGGMSSIDTPSLRGAQLAVKLINKSGGLLDGRMIELISVDAKTDQKAAAIGAKKLLSKGVIAGIGHSDPAFVLPSAPLFQKKGIPFVTSGATLPTLPLMIGDCMFMVPFGDDDQSFAILITLLRLLASKTWLSGQTTQWTLPKPCPNFTNSGPKSWASILSWKTFS